MVCVSEETRLLMSLVSLYDKLGGALERGE